MSINSRSLGVLRRVAWEMWRFQSLGRTVSDGKDVSKAEIRSKGWYRSVGGKNASIQHGRVSFPKKADLPPPWFVGSKRKSILHDSFWGKLLLEWRTKLFEKTSFKIQFSDSWVWGKDGLFPKNLEIRCSSHIPIYPEWASPWRSWPCWTVVGVDSLFVEHTED